MLSFWSQSLSNFGFSALFSPIASELNFSRAATSVAASATRAENGLVSPVVGWITDRFGPRWIVFSGVLIMGTSLTLMNAVNSLWAFYLVWGVLLGIGVNMGSGLALEKAITNWFVRKRGRALSIKWGFFALAAVVGLPLVGWIISMQGWRMTCVTAGIIIWVIGLPVAWFLIKQQRPEYYGLFPDGVKKREGVKIDQMIDEGVQYATEVGEVEFTLRQVMRTSTYWLLVLANASYGLSGFLVVHAVPFLTDMGVDPLKAAVTIGVMSSSNIPGTLLGGFFADRAKTNRLRFVIGGAYFLQTIGFGLYLISPTLTMVYPLFILYHFAGGIYGLSNSVISSRYFGRKAFGSVRGTSMMFMLPVSIAAPIYAGWIYDTTGSYIIVFTFCMVTLIISTIAILFASPPKPPVQVSDIRQIV